MLRFDIDKYELDIPQAFLINWDDYAQVLENMQAPRTEIHSADGVTTSIKTFGDTLHNAFRKVARPQQRVVDFADCMS